MGKTLMLCDCGGSMSLNSKDIAKASGLTCSALHTGLCTSGLDTLAQTLPAGDVLIACTQEAAVFDDLAAELSAPAPLCIDIRDRAGWSDQGGKATPKIAALLAEGMLPRPAVKAMDIESGSLCLVIGAADVAMPAAQQLSTALDVTVLLSDAPEILPDGLDILSGHIRKASGTLGRFIVTVDGLRHLDPAGRGALKFGPARDDGQSECDVILDLSGNRPLFCAPDKRDGYLRADPRDLHAVARAIFDAAQMEGTFEKPFYVTFEDHLCAHSRASQNGCHRCLDVCPTGAIIPNGDAVFIDPDICAGCGSCASVCPSGAVSYDAPSAVQFLFERLRTLASAYKSAGGKSPRLLVHDEEYGAEIIALSARFGRGLPADVLPLSIPNIPGFGHAEMLVALASGFVSVDILAGPKTEREALDPQLELARALAPERTARLNIIDPMEPDALSDTLYNAKIEPLDIAAILPLGGRREAARLAAQTLNGAAQTLPLPQGSPYGAVVVNNDACTLCLACASLCPTGALGDNPDKPQLNFREDACLQCGICTSTCPENAISLKPQMDLSDAALSTRVVHEEDPFACIECGKEFGVKSTINRIIEKLEGKHAMFTHSDNIRLIQMCDDCRIKVQYHDESAPMFAGNRAPTRTTEDYLKDKKPN